MTDMERASAMEFASVRGMVCLSSWGDRTGWFTKIYGITASASAWQGEGTCAVCVCADSC